jgi:hypothetical protein
VSKKKKRNVRAGTQSVLDTRYKKALKREKADKNYAAQKRRIIELYRLAKKLRDSLK